MKSLRVRLIVAFALVAVVPLVVAIALLSQRIRQTVREQAAERLTVALGMLGGQLGADGQRISERLRILARDPQLKRLYLVGTDRRDLADYLAEKQFLLGLDVLVVADTSGAVVAQGGPIPPLSAVQGPAEAALRLELVGEDSTLAMMSSAPIPYQNDVVGLLRGGVLLDAKLLARLKSTSGIDLALADPDGRRIADTFGGRTPPTSMQARSAPLEVGTGPRATITGLVSTAAADQTIAALQRTALLLAVLGITIAIALGALWSLQVSRPVERLAGFSERIALGQWEEPLQLESVRELQTLVTSLERMRTDLRQYRERLVASERQAAWSLMARKVAHEVKNPLTPIAVSVADLKRSFDQRHPDFPRILDQAVVTIGEEIETLKRLLQEFSDYGRFPSPRFEACRLSDLFADVEALYRREVAEGRLRVAGPEGEVVLRADRGQLRQALVNLVKNGLEAVNGDGHVELAAHREETVAVMLEVRDDGPGLDEAHKAQLFMPNFTTKSHGSGLGLTIVERIVSDHQGTIVVDSAPGAGSTFRIRLPLAAGGS